MANQWIEVFEHSARDTIAGSETSYPLPVMGNLKPKFEPTDEGRKEFYGADTGQGNASVTRKEELWNYSLECAAYPVAALGLLLLHALGKAVSRSVVDTTAYEGLLYALNMPFGSTGVNLEDKALGLKVYYDDGEGDTYTRTYYGGRVSQVEITGEGSDDVKYSFTLSGPGECITSAVDGSGATVPDPDDLPAPFTFRDCSFYIGAGITRTGTAPDFTDIDANTMDSFQPDSFSLSINLGREDKRKGTDLVTEKTAQMQVTCSFPLDIRDPSSGFSSRDELDAIISAVRESSVLITMDNGELAGSASQNYEQRIDLPLLFWKAPEEEFSTEGTQPKTTLEGEHLYDADIGYAVGIFVVDDNDAYPPS